MTPKNMYAPLLLSALQSLAGRRRKMDEATTSELNRQYLANENAGSKSSRQLLAALSARSPRASSPLANSGKIG
jgi:hypothetical protein